MVDGVIFDLDGTLWDSTEVVAKAYQRAASEYNLNVQITGDRLKQLFGKPINEIMETLFPDVDQDKLNELENRCIKYQEEELRKTPGKLYPDLEFTLKELSSQYPLFIVSNCQAGYIETFFDTTNLFKYFKDHTCPGDTGKLKGENILLIAEKHKLKNPIYVGDTVGDADACDFAGIPFVYASYGFGDVKEYDHRINGLKELTFSPFFSVF